MSIQLLDNNWKSVLLWGERVEPKSESSGKLVYSQNAPIIPFPVTISHEISLSAFELCHGDG